MGEKKVSYLEEFFWFWTAGLMTFAITMVGLCQSPILPVNPVSRAYTTIGSLIDPSVMMAVVLCLSAGVILGMAIVAIKITDRSWFLFPTLGFGTAILCFVVSAIYASSTILVAAVGIILALFIFMVSLVITSLIGFKINTAFKESQM